MIRRILKIVALSGLVVLKLFQHRWLGQMAPNEYFVQVTLNFLLFAFSANVAVMLVSWIYRRRKELPYPKVDNIVLGLENLYYIILAVAGIVMMFALMGIPPKELLTSMSIVAAAIAIIFKEFIFEIISGTVVGFSKDISIDDYVKVGEHRGKIINLTITKVALLNEDDDVIFIPNHMFITEEVVNYTKLELRKVNVEFEVDINSFGTIEELEADLTQALADYHEHIGPDSFHLRIVEVRKDSLALKFQYVVNRRERELEREIRKKTVRQVVNYVKTHLARKRGESF